MLNHLLRQLPVKEKKKKKSPFAWDSRQASLPVVTIQPPVTSKKTREVFSDTKPPTPILRKKKKNKNINNNNKGE